MCNFRPFTLRMKTITIKKNRIKLCFKRIADNCTKEQYYWNPFQSKFFQVMYNQKVNSQSSGSEWQRKPRNFKLQTAALALTLKIMWRKLSVSIFYSSQWQLFDCCMQLWKHTIIFAHWHGHFMSAITWTVNAMSNTAMPWQHFSILVALNCTGKLHHVFFRNVYSLERLFSQEVDLFFLWQLAAFQYITITSQELLEVVVQFCSCSLVRLICISHRRPYPSVFILTLVISHLVEKHLSEFHLGLDAAPWER